MNEDQSFRLKDATLIAFGTGLAVLVAFCAGVSTPHSFLGAAGASLALALGASLVGTLLGFLFGIPRTVQQEGAPTAGGDPSAARDISYRVNTNLEQISDWLTKIIIGVSLVELGEIGGWLWGFSVDVGKGFAGEPELAQAFVLGFLLYFFVCGFLFGYLWTRLFFGRAIRQADEGLVGRIEKWEAEARADGLAVVTVQRQLTAGGPPVPEKELQDAVLKASSPTRARLYYEAVAARRSPQGRERSIPVFEALIASDKDKVYHQNLAQLAYALKDKAVPDWPKALQLLTDAIAMRNRNRDDGYREYEFNRAVCRRETGGAAADIEADLRAAAADDWTRTWRLEGWDDWLAARNLTAEALGFEAT